MKLNLKQNPRVFTVGNNIKIKDFGKIHLNNNEMVSFVQNNKEYDFVAKDWGFYASPSINARLKREGFKTALVVNKHNQLYIMVVDKDKIIKFKDYLKDNQDNRIICWLDDFYKEEI
jgi:hypothetical protein